MDLFTNYAYQPYLVYLAMCTMMFLSCFGLPIPEEVTIVGVGVAANIARNFPPPFEGARGVNVWMAAAIGFLVVILADGLIYYLGRRYGRKFLARPFVAKHCPPKILRRAEAWMRRYGYWASGVFRFTPGLRFPGHLACGMMNVPFNKFILIDGAAALISIPTQIILIGLYGQDVLHEFLHYQTYFIWGLVGVGLLFFIRHRTRLKHRFKHDSMGPNSFNVEKLS